VSDLEDVRPFLEAFAAEPLPASWSSLCLRGSVDDEDELVASLERLAPALAPLEELGLPLSDYLSEEAELWVKRLVRAAVGTDEMPALHLPEVYMEW